MSNPIREYLEKNGSDSLASSVLWSIVNEAERSPIEDRIEDAISELVFANTVDKADEQATRLRELFTEMRDQYMKLGYQAAISLIVSPFSSR